jgi:hypothetical protein
MRYHVAVTLALLSAPVGPAFADMSEYRRLLEENAVSVITETRDDGTVEQTFDMGEGVEVTCDQDGCMGFDWSEDGAVGCAFSIMLLVQATAQACELPLPEDRLIELERMTDLTAEFIAANSLPRQSVESVRLDVTEFLKGYRQETALNPEVCTRDAEVIMQMAEGMTSPEGIAANAHSLSRPRLPVMNPCL